MCMQFPGRDWWRYLWVDDVDVGANSEQLLYPNFVAHRRDYQ